MTLRNNRNLTAIVFRKFIICLSEVKVNIITRQIWFNTI